VGEGGGFSHGFGEKYDSELLPDTGWKRQNPERKIRRGLRLIV